MKSITVLSLVFLLFNITFSAVAANDPSRPNLIVIVVDDQRWDEFGAAGHPYLNTPNIDRLAREGVMFTSAYTVSPLCSPNRASILTGQYISRHGIVDNIARDRASHRLDLFAIDLQQAGYETAHIGKWHMGNDPTPRPGYDHWISFPGQGRSLNPQLYENDQLHTVNGYLTDILTNRAIDFIRKDRDKPFFLYIGHKAIHPEVKQLDDGSVDTSYGAKYLAAKRHQGIYKDKVFPRRPNANTSTSQQPEQLMLNEILTAKHSRQLVSTFGALLDRDAEEGPIRDRAEMLLSVDDGLGKIMETLEEQRILNNTVILFTSDNGYFYGEHGLSVERRLPYEEGVRVPLLIRHPSTAKAGTRIDQFALSIDIAPTMLDYANADESDTVQGKSLKGLLTGNQPDWRDSFLIEYVSYEKPMPWLINTDYKAVRMGHYKYIRWLRHENRDELYDLNNDPYEMNNLINDPAHSTTLPQLKSELAKLVAESLGL